MHNESLLGQVACKALVERLIPKSEPGSADRKFLEAGTMSAINQHMAVIERFGRYPSRNKVLNRESTPDELEYLRENPEGFAKNPPEASA